MAFCYKAMDTEARNSCLERMLGSIEDAMANSDERNIEGMSIYFHRSPRQLVRCNVTEKGTEEILHAFLNRAADTAGQVQQFQIEYEGEVGIVADKLGTGETLPSGTRTLVRQIHRGPRHGRWGRRRGPSKAERERRIGPEIAKVMARTTVAICGGSISTVLHGLKLSFQRVHPSHVFPSDGYHLFETVLTDLVRGKTRGVYEVLPAPYFIVCIKVSYSQAGFHSLGAMDRHAICSWLGFGGRPMCSCVGSTRFKLHSDVWSCEGNEVGSGRGVQPCTHVNGITEFIRTIGSCFLADFKAMATVISDIYIRKFGHTLTRYIHTRHRVRLVHKESIAVISEIAPGTTDMIQFTPVRKMIRGSGGFVCASCDTVLVGREGCHHTRVMKTLRQDDDLSSEGETGGERTDPGEELLVDDSNHLDDNGGDMEVDHNGSGQGDREMDVHQSVEDHKSHLPLCPVNCARSLKVDQQVARCAASRERYVLTAPSTCQKCGAHGNPKSRSSWEGVIMCTLGPCALDVENFRCAREGCQSVIETEGREQCILLLKNTAATHALLRRELMGVALSNGTLNGRLTHFHSQLISIQQAGIIGASPECRSVRTLRNLCNVMLKLMTMDPEKSLFSSDTCDRPDFQHGFRRPALCLDGINQGYRKSKQVSLQNFVEICTSIPSSSEGAINPRTCRPLTTLIRRTDTVSVLLKAVKRDDLEVTKGNISDFAAAIRLVYEDAILPQFCAA